jgi:signal transduction histidine kinase/CheY-like chemotaxis protein
MSEERKFQDRRRAAQPDTRLRDANEQLTLAALQAQERADEWTEHVRHQAAVNADLVKHQQQLRSLTSQLTLAEQRERKRLATELHDYLAQLLVVGRLKIGRARPQAADPSLLTLMDDIDEILSKSLTYTRTLMAALSPPVLYELGLPSALRWLGEQMLTEGLTVEVRLSCEQVPMAEDQAILLYQSVRELLLNVVKHAGTPQATVRMSLDEEDMVVLCVQDDGRGSDRLWVEGKTGGEQFGLVSIRERMDAMGGWLRAESAEGQGTTVTLCLPLARPAVPEPASADVIRPQGPTRSFPPKLPGMHRVLLVDDHAMVRQGLRALLDSYSDLCVIGEAADGEEAVSMVAVSFPEFVLMDVNMPNMDGIEATKQIKAAWPATMVIGLSVNTSPQVMEAMQLAGAVAFVSKDAAAEQLHDVITRFAS